MVLIAANCPDTGGLKAFKESPEGRAIMEASGDLYAAERARVRGDFIRGRVADGMAAQAAGLTFDAVERGELADDWRVMFRGGDCSATIAEIRREPALYDGMDCCDPAEPDYRKWANVAQVRFHNDMVRIVTQAHGGPHWYTTRAYAPGDVEALAWCAAKEGLKVFGGVAAPAVPAGVEPADVVPPAPARQSLEEIIDPALMAQRLAELPEFECARRMDSAIAGLGVGKADMKREVKRIRAELARANIEIVKEAAEVLTLSKEDPRSSALAFKERSYPHLLYCREEFLNWRAGAYEVIDAGTLASQVGAFLDMAMVETIDPQNGQIKLTRFKPKSEDINQVLVALGHISNSTAPYPSWLQDWDFDINQVIPFPNGWLDSETSTFYPPTPNLFTPCALSFDYDLAAPAPEFFFETMRQWWPAPSLYAEMAAQAQRFFGLLLTADTSYQKIFMALGRPRSGKSAFARLATSLVGKGNTASCASRALAKGDFVFDGFRGKSLIVFPDMRVKSDVAEDVLEKLLNISGEDTVGINRKKKSYLYEKLNCRLLIVANLFPDFKDATGALSARIIPFQFNESFEGREDRRLEARLNAELPGIVNWALGGLKALRQEESFTLGPVARSMVASAYHQGAPLADFVCSHLIEDPEGCVGKTELYNVYKSWATFGGEDKPLHPTQFSIKLRATVATIGDARPRNENGKHIPTFTGIRLLGV
jgi:putative DNA primase/helicase